MMTKADTLARIYELGLLAVVRGPTQKLTLDMVHALVEGGVTGIEITFTTPNATQVVQSLKDHYGGDILLGMGTLTDMDDAAQAKAAGATFIVSPHVENHLAASMVDSGLVVMIGSYTPSEILHASRLGSDIVKLFPGSLGGPSYLKSLRGPFPNIRIMPTGGVDLDNIADWFEAGAVAVGAGSALCPRKWAEEGRFDEITSRARAFTQGVQDARS